MNTQEKLQFNALAIQCQQLVAQNASLSMTLLQRERAELEAEAKAEEQDMQGVVAKAAGVSPERVVVEGLER